MGEPVRPIRELLLLLWWVVRQYIDVLHDYEWYRTERAMELMSDKRLATCLRMCETVADDDEWAEYCRWIGFIPELD